MKATCRVTLKKHLANLRTAERIQRAPLSSAERRAASAVPSLTQLATICRVSGVTMTKFANNRQTDVNRDILAGVKMELERRGYPTAFDDLLEMIEVPDEPKNAP